MSDRRTVIYTVHTLSGEEQIVSCYMDKLLESDIILDKFIPMREFPRRVNGRWERRMERLFPGYMFIEAKDPEILFFRLKRIPKLSKILADGENTFYSLSEEEIRYIKRIGLPRHDHTFGMSQVMIEDGDGKGLFKPGERVRVVSGDLLDFQGDIVRYDLHHRKVYLRTDLFGGTQISVGIELIQRV